MDRNRNAGIHADILFVGMTRPTMKWGVMLAPNGY